MATPADESGSFDFTSSIAETYDAFALRLVGALPDIIGAVLLLLAGWGVAVGVRALVRRLIAGLDSFLPTALRSQTVGSSGLRLSYASLLSKVAFWSVLVFFIAAAAHMLGWTLFSDWSRSLVGFLPQLVTGLLIIFAGLLMGGGAKTLAVRAAVSAKLQQPELIGRLTQMAVVFTMAVIGIEQLGINVHFLTTILYVVVGVILAGGALAFGLGARPMIANIIGAQYVRKYARIGQEMKMGGVEGTVIEITQTAIILETATGQAVVPASQFHEHVCHFPASEEQTNVRPTRADSSRKDVGDA
ncbi:MAG: hypothetical protein SynsKO_36530 [Synoicihabitans sp.]